MLIVQASRIGVAPQPKSGALIGLSAAGSMRICESRLHSFVDMHAS